MNADTGWVLIGSGAALMVAGLVMIGVSAMRAPRRRRQPVRSRAGLTGALTCTSVVCGVITCVQWAVLSRTGPGVAWAVVLWLPAFLAGATVARLFIVWRIVIDRRRQARAARRVRGADR
jgi:hypothetical protein